MKKIALLLATIIMINITPISKADVPLNEAVDNYIISLNTGGNLPWFGQTTVYSYGGDAAQSGSISNNQNSWLSTRVEGHRKYIVFDWKVSSEKDYDFLKIYMDGELLDKISGDVGWHAKAYYIPTTWHTFDWKYEKDGTVSSGSDAGWVDRVEIVPVIGSTLDEAVDNYALGFTTGINGWYGERAISFYGADAAQSGYIYHNDKSEMYSGITGPGTLSFYWKVSSQPVYDALMFYVDNDLQGIISGNVQDWQRVSVTIPSGYHSLRWAYGKDYALTDGADAGWVDKVEFTPTIITVPLGEAVDNTALTWNTGGTANWYGQKGIYFYGGDAAQSSQIPDNGYTYLRTSVNGPGTLSYYWKVSSETNYDYLNFYIDGVLKKRISGQPLDWQLETFNIASGSHTLEWTYRKDADTKAGSDAGWLDRVQYKKTSLTVTSPNGGENWARCTYKEIKWTPGSTTGSYVKIELLKGGLVNYALAYSTVNTGSYNWLIPCVQTIGTDYKIRITSTSSPAITDTSNNNFAISSEPKITVKYPNGGEKLARGTTKTIRWSYTLNPGANVKIELLKAGVLNKVITYNAPIGSYGQGTYNWAIPSTQTLGSDYKIRITSANLLYTDTSNNNFIISNPYVTVTSPNGGESWQRGTTKTITWKKDGNVGSYVKIDLYKAGVFKQTIVASTPNDGSHSWYIPTTQTLGTDYKIKITSTSNTAYFDWSNNFFRIY